MADEKKVVQLHPGVPETPSNPVPEAGERRVSLVSFPGGLQQFTFPPGPVSLRMLLTRAGIAPADFAAAEMAVNNTVTTDFSTLVPDGAIVTRTTRVEGGC